MFAQSHDIALVTATGGGATGYTPVVTGEIRSVRYIKDGTTPMASTTDITVTTEASAQAVLAVVNQNASAQFAPRQAVHTATGAVAAGIYAPFVAANERVKVVVAQGGITKNGTIRVIIA